MSIETTFKISGENNRFDLHNHTTYSDGQHTPEELIKEAKEKGITHLSITDHDTIGAYTEGRALEIARDYGVNLVPGTEITFSLNKNGNTAFRAHLLLYFPEELFDSWDFIFDFEKILGIGKFKKEMKKVVNFLNQKRSEDIKLMKERGVEGPYFFKEINPEEVLLSRYGDLGKSLQQSLFAHFSPNGFGISDITRELLGEAISSSTSYSTEIEVSLLQKKYEIYTVLAHPDKRRGQNLDDLFLKFELPFIQKNLSKGFLDGVESQYCSYSQEKRDFLKKTFDLRLNTGGSDTHRLSGYWSLQNLGISEITN